VSLFLPYNILSNLVTIQENIKDSSASKRMAVQFQILFRLEKIDHCISYHASQVLYFWAGLFDPYFHA